MFIDSFRSVPLHSILSVLFCSFALLLSKERKGMLKKKYSNIINAHVLLAGADNRYI